VEALSDFDRRRLEQLNTLIRDDLDLLDEIDKRQAVENRPLEKRQLRQQADQVRESYNQHREEYAGLLLQETPSQSAPGEQALIHPIVQQLDADPLTVTHTALQKADRDPADPAFAQLLAEVAALPAVQQQLAVTNATAANQIAKVASILQAPTADLKQKLKLSILLIPLFLSYETDFNLNITANHKVVWERLT
jgi:hypothetical protein